MGTPRPTRPAPPPTPRPTRPAPPPTPRPTRPAAPACPAICRPGFQSNGRCEVPCHVPACGYDPDCNKPVEEPTNLYLPPERDACPPGSPGCGGSYNVQGLAPPARRSGRRNTAKINVSKSNRNNNRGREDSSPVRNNWDLFFKTGIIKRKG